MFALWLILGAVMIFMGIFNRQMMRLLGFKPASEIMVSPNLRRSTKIVEQIGRWLVITLGVSFVVLGLGIVFPSRISHLISILLLGLSAVMLVAMIAITMINWKAK
jgi:hypothetical protein